MNVASNRFLSVMGVVLVPLSVWAHGGEDHGDAPAPVAIASSAPRLSTHTDQFELAGVLQGKVLTLYLDRFDTNTPVAHAQIELESGAWKGVATETAPAVYSVPAELLAQAGKHPLAITVQTGDATDLLDATLEVGQVGLANVGAPHTHFWGEWAVWWGAAALSMAAAALVVVRRNRRHRKHTPS